MILHHLEIVLRRLEMMLRRLEMMLRHLEIVLYRLAKTLRHSLSLLGKGLGIGVPTGYHLAKANLNYIKDV
jgi:hypothetical protein